MEVIKDGSYWAPSLLVAFEKAFIESLQMYRMRYVHAAGVGFNLWLSQTSDLQGFVSALPSAGYYY